MKIHQLFVLLPSLLKLCFDVNLTYIDNFKKCSYIIQYKCTRFPHNSENKLSFMNSSL